MKEQKKKIENRKYINKTRNKNTQELYISSQQNNLLKDKSFKFILGLRYRLQYQRWLMKTDRQQKGLYYEPIQITLQDSNECVSLTNQKIQVVQRRQLKQQHINRTNSLFPTLVVISSVIIFFCFLLNENFQKDRKQLLENVHTKNQVFNNSEKTKENDNIIQIVKQQRPKIPQQTDAFKPKEQKIQEEKILKESQQQKKRTKIDVKKQEKPELKTQVFQNKIFTDEYEYDVRGRFNLWDLNPRAKDQMFRRYNALPSKKKLIKGDKYMEINYGRDDQFLDFSKNYEENIEVVDWYSQNLTEVERVNLTNEFQNALKKRRQKIETLNMKYNNIYSGKQGFYERQKSITYKRFLQSLQYQLLTGENLQKNIQIKKIYERQKEYFQNMYHTDKPKNEIHACVLIPTYNNVAGHRYLWNIESILQQQYNNYRLIIIDDGSTDETSLKIAQHLNWRGVSKQKAVLIRNKKHVSALPNVYYGIHKYCDYNQIFYTIDGDDEIIGTQVFKLFNALYQQKKYYTLYSSYYQYFYTNYNDPIRVGIPFQYPQQIKKTNSYRLYKHAYSQLRTGMTDLFLLINIKSLQDQEGELYKVISDNALYFSAMQMSCGRVDYVPELEYWYNANTGINDWMGGTTKSYVDSLNHINVIQKHYQCIHKTIAQIQVSLLYENSI